MIFTMKKFTATLLFIAVANIAHASPTANSITDGTNLKYTKSGLDLFNLSAVVKQDDINALASSPTWHKLLLLDKKGKPTTADPKFFLAQGEPHAEMSAIIRAIQANDDQTLCAFPARASFVAQGLGLALDDEHCRAFHAWAKTHDARALSLVFAEEHPNSLGSAFAHVMIKADTAESLASGRDEDAFAINYTVAREKGDSEAQASVKSMIGQYAGVMEFYDYAQKRDVYLNDDERDIWEYRLDLNEGEVAQIMRHIWETKDLKRPYFFTNDNCATEILRLIDVAKGTALRQSAGKIVIPSEIARLLNDSGLIASTRFLPSKSSKAQALLNQGDGGHITSHSDPAHSAPTHRIGVSVGHDDSHHGTHDEGGAVYGLSLRSAYHDPLDRPTGVRQYLEVEMLSLDVRYDDKLKVDKATLFSTRSYNPANTAKAHKGKAWGQHLRLLNTTDGSGRANNDHLVLDVRLEQGKSWTLGQGEQGTGRLSDTLCYALAGYGGQVGHVNKGYRVGVGANLGCIHYAGDKWRMMGELALPLWYHHNEGEARSLYVQPSAHVGVQYDLNRTNAIRLTGSIERGHDDTQEKVMVQYLKYF